MMSTSNLNRPVWIGLDIGGANIKAAHQDGHARTVPFEVWKRPDDLGRAIAAAAAALPASDRVAVTMTAELCDCYPTKAVGVNLVLDGVLAGVPGRSIVVWGVDGEFHSVDEARRQPHLAAAANWLALANVAARSIPESQGLLIDIGSTTTDLIPLDRGRVAARGQSDTGRLQTGELVYAGVRRTPVCALATELPFRGIATGLAAEIFASTLDVYLTLAEIASNPSDLSTADGRPATVEAARDRLARMVGADCDGFSAEDALAFAHAADECLIRRLVMAAERATGPTIGRPTAAVVSGSGEFLARRLARRIIEPNGPIVSLREAWGPVASSAGCAYALVKLAPERFGADDDRAGDPRVELAREGDRT
jgi:(4-(4-[2-(gamma-L-glutamylamino)ethyl]phenoxymethyl)furan-2-yl)methanamine synthase